MTINRVVIHSKRGEAICKNEGKVVTIAVKPVRIMGKTAIDEIENSINHCFYNSNLGKYNEQGTDDSLNDNGAE